MSRSIREPIEKPGFAEITGFLRYHLLIIKEGRSQIPYLSQLQKYK
jgi:hypothetical protein